MPAVNTRPQRKDRGEQRLAKREPTRTAGRSAREALRINVEGVAVSRVRGAQRLVCLQIDRLVPVELGAEIISKLTSIKD